MTGPSYHVDPAQLREHADRLTAHATRLSSVGSALPGEPAAQSLGVFAQFITLGIGKAMTATTEAFTTASSTMDTVAEGLRRAAERYERSDDDHAAALADLGSSLGEDVR